MSNAGSTELDYWCGTNKSAPAAQGSLRTNQQRYYGQAQADRKEAAAHHAARAPAPQEADGADRQADQRARLLLGRPAAARLSSKPVALFHSVHSLLRLLVCWPPPRSLVRSPRSLVRSPRSLVRSPQGLLSDPNMDPFYLWASSSWWALTSQSSSRPSRRSRSATIPNSAAKAEKLPRSLWLEGLSARRGFVLVAR